MEAKPELFPKYQDLRVLDAVGRWFTSTPNYLNHPTPYYFAMGVVDRLTGELITALRMANLTISTAAIVILIAVGFRLLKSWLERTIYAMALVLFPKIGLLAGLINNDNAALFAVGVACLGLADWHRKPSAASASLLALGIALCGWVKLTALVMIGLATIIAELQRPCLHTRAGRPALPSYSVVAAGFVVAAIPTLMNFAAYGRPLFQAWRPDDIPPGPNHLSFLAYAAIFFNRLTGDWSALTPTPVSQSVALVIVLAFTAKYLFDEYANRQGLNGDHAVASRIATALILATIPTLLIHLEFGWRTYLENGETNSSLMRYYYAVWPGYALALALLWLRSKGRFWSTPALICVGLFLFLCSPLFMELAAALRGGVVQ